MPHGRQRRGRDQDRQQNQHDALALARPRRGGALGAGIDIRRRAGGHAGAGVGEWIAGEARRRRRDAGDRRTCSRARRRLGRRGRAADLRARRSGRWLAGDRRRACAAADGCFGPGAHRRLGGLALSSGRRHERGRAEPAAGGQCGPLDGDRFTRAAGPLEFLGQRRGPADKRRPRHRLGTDRRLGLGGARRRHTATDHGRRQLRRGPAEHVGRRLLRAAAGHCAAETEVGRVAFVRCRSGGADGGRPHRLDGLLAPRRTHGGSAGDSDHRRRHDRGGGLRRRRRDRLRFDPFGFDRADIVAGDSSTVSSIAGPSIDGPSIDGPSIAELSIADSSVAGVSIPGCSPSAADCPASSNADGGTPSSVADSANVDSPSIASSSIAHSIDSGVCSAACAPSA